MRPRLAFYGSTPAYKVVLDARRLGRPAGRTQPAVEDRRLGDDVGADHRRDRRRVRHVRHPRRDRAAGRRNATATSSAACRSTRRAASAPRSSPASSPASGVKRRHVARERDPVDRLRRTLRHVVPGDVHDRPARGLDRGDAAAIALPLQPIAVPFEPVAFADDAQPRPRIVDSIVADLELRCRLRQLALAGGAERASLRGATPRSRVGVSEHVADECRSRSTTAQCSCATPQRRESHAPRPLNRRLKRLAVDQRPHSRPTSASRTCRGSHRSSPDRAASVSRDAISMSSDRTPRRAEAR